MLIRECLAGIKSSVFCKAKVLCRESRLGFAAGAKRQPVPEAIARQAPCPLGLRTLFFGKSKLP